MADIFVSYAREDRAKAEQIARALQATGLDVFWDTEIPPGQTWADYIEQKLANCKAALVLWSGVSTGSQWVREEARLAKERGKLIPVQLDGSPMPFGFGEVQAANLSSWTGDANDRDFQRLMSAVRDAVTRAPAPQAAYAPPPHYAPPPPSYQSPPAYQAGAPAAGQLSPWGYIQKCLQMYLNGAGRARRSEYWWFVLFEIAVIVVAVIFDGIWNAGAGNFQPVYLVTGLAVLALICPAVCVAIRRVHDINITGWVVLVGAIPYVGGLIMLVLALIPGTAGPNKFGPDPKAP
ncbi:MAG: DUF805 domain-containing protein [Hyphomonadaceae bacterium]|nr:DUF805 domain-containing protein [Hyphomonadaceae bacterium]